MQRRGREGNREFGSCGWHPRVLGTYAQEQAMQRKLLRHAWTLVSLTARKYGRDGVARMGAAIAFYSLFSLAPLLLVVTAAGAVVFGEHAARTETIDRVREIAGDTVAEGLQVLAVNAAKFTQRVTATAVAFAIVLWAASRVFIELRTSFNDIWAVDRRNSNVLKMALRDRVASFGMVLLTGFSLLASMMVTAVMAWIRQHLAQSNPSLLTLLPHAYPFVAFGVTTFLLALVYKALPACKVAWGDVWLGALLGAGLFTFGKYLIGLYLARTTLVSVYGTAGSLVVLLIWIYYTAQILLLGAVVSAIYSERLGSRHKQSMFERLVHLPQR